MVPVVHLYVDHPLVVDALRRELGRLRAGLAAADVRPHVIGEGGVHGEPAEGTHGLQPATSPSEPHSDAHRDRTL